MRFRKRQEIIKFFDVSIIMYSFKCLNEFSRVLPLNAKYFQRNGIEIVILLEEPSEEQRLLDLIEQYPFINFKIITDRTSQGHYDRRGKVLNAGIKAASFNYILILNPDVKLITDLIYQLRYILFHYAKSFAASVFYMDDIQKATRQLRSYSSIMVLKKDALEVCGYGEGLKEMEGENAEICCRLELFGLEKIEILEAEAAINGDRRLEHDVLSLALKEKSVRSLKNIFFPKEVVLNNENWGGDFKEVIWDWNNNKSFSELKKFLDSFNTSTVLDNKICEENYGIIALIQVRNECRNITGVLNHLRNYCDGILLLDDGSIDGSFEIAKDEKLLVKVQKNYKGYFDDLENRNDLLKLASFFKSKWFFFIDADERFDPRYDHIRFYANKGVADVYRFHLVDIWDNPGTYRIDIPDRRNNGITDRARMFRNQGSMQIYSCRELHFSPVPYSNNMENARILLLHYGNFDPEIRKYKHTLYSSQDPEGKKNGFSYDFLKDSKVVLGELDNLNLDD